MDLFSGLQSFFKTNATITDNYIFRLHYKVTTVILVAFSILVTARQYIGDPIDCMGNSKGDKTDEFLDTFCWINTTFSVSHAWQKEVGAHVSSAGVDNSAGGVDTVYHAYYQWVCFVLFLQAILFYIPRYFWKAMEDGKVKSLILELNSPVLSEQTKKDNRALLVEYLTLNLNNHSLYFLSFIVAEIMNFVNVVGQICLMHTFLGGKFGNYGYKVSLFSGWQSSVAYDPMVEVFPQVTKCTYHQYGPSGTVEKEDAMCVLPVNIINEKIYLFLWFWFIILSVMSGLALVYRAVIIFWPKSRFLVFRFRAHKADEKHLESIVNVCQAGDWLLFYLLCKNIDSLNFRDVVSDFAKKMEGQDIAFV